MEERKEQIILAAVEKEVQEQVYQTEYVVADVVGEKDLRAYYVVEVVVEDLALEQD